MSWRERLSASICRPSSSRSSRISSQTISFSISMSANVGSIRTSAKRPVVSRERLGGQRHREDAEVDLRRGVEVAAEALEREVHVVRVRKARRASIEHVLEEVREPVLLRGLEARADAHVESDVRAMELRLRRDDDAESVVERLDPEVALAVRCARVHGLLFLVVARGARVGLRAEQVVLVDLDLLLRRLAEAAHVVARAPRSASRRGAGARRCRAPCRTLPSSPACAP